MKIKSIAAIDVGSNAIRLLINNVEDYEERKAIKKNAYIRVPVRLGEDVFKDGYMGDGKTEDLLKTIKSFALLMHVFKVSAYYACATSAMREADNGPELVEKVKKNTGIEIDIISGNQEADLIFSACSFDGLMTAGVNYLHVDVGGGSTEIVVYCDQRKEASYSFPIGTLRILAGGVSLKTREKLESILQEIHERYAPRDIIASGGNINKTLKLLGKNDGDAASFAQVDAFYQQLAALTFEERLEKYQMNSYRADVIVPALSIFLTIGRACHVGNYIIPKVGLVDGIIRQMHSGPIIPRPMPQKIFEI